MPFRINPRCLSKSQPNFNDFRLPNEVPNGAKIAQKSTSAPKARPRAPKSRREAQKDPPGGPNSRPSEAHKHTKKLFENTGQKVFRNRFTQDPRKALGSVAGLGALAPLEIRPLSL